MLAQLTVTLSVLAFSLASAALYTPNPDIQKRMWETYKIEYHKKYTGQEESKRFNVFLENLKIADQRTEAERKNGGTAFYGINKFSDMSKEEFRKTHLNDKVSDYKKDETHAVKVNRRVDDTATEVDWTGIYTTPVKDQGYCGSCWAFSAAEQIESDVMRLSNVTYELSPEQLVECTFSCEACNGGNSYQAFEYVESVGGIETEESYPYSSYYDTSFLCRANAAKFVAKVSNWYQIGGSDAAQIESSMADYVLATGPMAIVVDASQWSNYKGGIVTVCGTKVDHAVQAVGLNITGSDGYWKVRNSWGASWGENGFIRLAYGKNTCDLTYQTTYTNSTTK